MKKIFSLLAAVLFAGSMMAETITITPASGFKSAYNNAGTFAIGDVEFAFNAGVMYNGKGNPAGFASKQLIQFRKSSSGAGEFANNTSLDLKSITIATQNDKPYTLSVGTSADELSAASNPTTSTGKYACKDNLDADKEIDVTLHTYDVEGNNYFKFVNGANAQYIAYITIELAGGDVEPTEEYYLTGSIRNWAQTADEDYKFVVNTAAEGEYMLQGITLAADDELKVIGIVGETVNWYPAGQDNNYVVAADGSYDIYFRPDGQGGEDWHQGYFYVAEVVPPTAISCLEVYQLAKDDVVGLLNPVTVTYSNGANVWVKDGSASMLIYLPSGFANNFQAGDVLSGISGVVDIYQNIVYEVKPSADQAAAIVATPGEAPAPSQAAVIEASDVNKYVILPGFSIEGEFTTASKTSLSAVLGENTVTIYNNFKFAYTFEAGKTYDIIGVVSAYKGNPQVYFISATENTATAIDNAAIEIKAFKTIENGQLVIIKNGVRYDATGAVIR